MSKSTEVSNAVTQPSNETLAKESSAPAGQKRMSAQERLNRLAPLLRDNLNRNVMREDYEPALTPEWRPPKAKE